MLRYGKYLDGVFGEVGCGVVESGCGYLVLKKK